MGLMNVISKKTSFTVAVGVSMILWAGLAAFFGILCDYIVMQEKQMALFMTIITVIGIMAPICMTIQIVLLGLIKPLSLKPLRPIIDNLDGLEIKSRITIPELEETLTALKRFPEINAIIGLLLCSVIILTLIGTVYLKGYEFFWVMTQVIFGALAVLIYGVATFLYSSAKANPMRKKVYYLLNEYKKNKRKN